MLEERVIKYYSRKDPNIALKVIPGHFSTKHTHLNCYLDVTTMKTRANEAERIAIAMKDYYNVMGRPIDTIVCLDGCEVIGAFLASELSRAGILSMNAHKTIYVVTPEHDIYGDMIFSDQVKYSNMISAIICLVLMIIYLAYELKRYFELPNREPDAIIGVCDTKDKGEDFACLPVAYVYGQEYYIEDVIYDNSQPDIVDARLVEILLRNKWRGQNNERQGRKFYLTYQ